MHDPCILQYEELLGFSRHKVFKVRQNSIGVDSRANNHDMMVLKLRWLLLQACAEQGPGMFAYPFSLQTAF